MVGGLYDHGLGGTGGVIVRNVASGRTRARLPQSADGDSGANHRLGATAVTAAWAPAGDRIVLRDFDADSKAALAIMPAGGLPRIVVPAGNAGFWNVQWSPDGRRLAYDS